MDDGGRYFYIKDGDTVWNPGFKPCRTALDHYECRHGLGYTKIKAEKNGIKAENTFFVPLKFNGEIQKVVLKNTTNKEKQFKLFSFVEFALWDGLDDQTNYQRNYSVGEVEIEGNVIYHKTEYRERRNHYSFYSVNTDISGYDTDREDFLGIYNGFDSPDSVMNGQSKNTKAVGWAPIGSHQIDITLKAGEEKNTCVYARLC